MKKQKSDVYQIVTDKIIELLEKGVTPWRKPWNAANNAIRPQNYKSKHQYKGINFFILAACFENPFFLTFKQISEMGGKVIKGEKATQIFHWNWNFFDADGKRVKTEKEAFKKFPSLKYYNVFNAPQIEGIEFEMPPVVELQENQKIENCENLVRSCENLTLEFKNKKKAFYSPSRDVVNMPTIEQFDDSPEYYSTLFHEMGHWTGHKTRLNRFKKGAKSAAFGSKEYGKEELVAEMCSAFLCFDCQIDLPKLVENQAAYLGGWLNTIRADNKILMTAAAQAEKAAKFINPNR